MKRPLRYNVSGCGTLTDMGNSRGVLVFSAPTILWRAILSTEGTYRRLPVVESHLKP